MLGLGLGLGLAPTSGGIRYRPEALALFERMSVEPTNARKAQINALFSSVASILPKLDSLYLTAAHDAQAARLNWVADQYNLSAVNSPTFVTDSGYTGNGTSSYLSTGMVTSTLNSSGKMKQNSLTMGAFVLSEVNALQAVVGSTSDGSNSLFLIPNYSTRVTRGAAYSAADGYVFASPQTTIEQYSIARNDVASFILRRAGADLPTILQTSQTPGANNIDVLRGVGTYFPGEVGAAFFGEFLSNAEDLALRNAIRSYLVSIGRLP